MKKTLTLLGMLCILGKAYAATYTLSSGSYESQAPSFVNGDVLTIPSGASVTVSSSVTFPNITMNVSGTLTFLNVSPKPKWDFGSGSVINVTSSGTIVGNGSNANQITIGGNTVFRGSDPNVTGPSRATSTSSGFQSTPLPLYFTRFDATVTGEAVKLQWVVASDIRSNVFAVERSTDGIAWKILQTISVQDAGMKAATYTYTDAAGSAGTYYYRIGYTGNDGSSGYSATAIARVNVKNTITAGVNGQLLQLRFPDLTSEQKLVVITDMQGRTVVNRTVTAAEQEATISLPQPGMYILHLTAGNTCRYVQKIVSDR